MYTYSELEVKIIIWSLRNPCVHFYIYLLNCYVPESLEHTIKVYFFILERILIAKRVFPAPHGRTIYPLLAISPLSFKLTTEFNAAAWYSLSYVNDFKLIFMSKHKFKGFFDLRALLVIYYALLGSIILSAFNNISFWNNYLATWLCWCFLTLLTKYFLLSYYSSSIYLSRYNASIFLIISPFLYFYWWLITKI